MATKPKKEVIAQDDIIQGDEVVFPENFRFAENVENPVQSKGKTEYTQYLFSLLEKAQEGVKPNA